MDPWRLCCGLYALSSGFVLTFRRLGLSLSSGLVWNQMSTVYTHSAVKTSKLAPEDVLNGQTKHTVNRILDHLMCVVLDGLYNGVNNVTLEHYYLLAKMWQYGPPKAVRRFCIPQLDVSSERMCGIYIMILFFIMYNLLVKFKAELSGRFSVSNVNLVKQPVVWEMSRSHGGHYEDYCLRCCAVYFVRRLPAFQGDRSCNRSSTHLRNVGELLLDYTAQTSKRL
jgi:hypothetical protein